MKVGEADQALAQLKIASELQPQNPYVRNILGALYGQKGLYDDAIAEFEEARRISPDEPAFRSNLDRRFRLNVTPRRGRAAPLNTATAWGPCAEPISPGLLRNCAGFAGWDPCQPSFGGASQASTLPTVSDSAKKPSPESRPVWRLRIPDRRPASGPRGCLRACPLSSSTPRVSVADVCPPASHPPTPEP